MRRGFVLMLCVMIAAAFSVVLPWNQAQAGTKRVKMPTRIVFKPGSGDGTTVLLSYNKKGDITKCVTYEGNDKKDKDVQKISYKYKNGKKSTATIKGDDWVTRVTFDQAGRVTRVENKDSDEKKYHPEKIVTYGNNTFKAINWYLDDDDEYTVTKGKMTASTTSTNNGKKVVLKGKSAFGGTSTETRSYNKNGLRISVEGFYPYEENTTTKYTYKLKSGLVTECKEKSGKAVFTYGKTKANQQAYLNAINHDESSINHYLYEFGADDYDD